MNIAICDDLETDRKIIIDMIHKYCKNYNLEVKLSTYKNGEELISNFSSKKFVLIFLDIYMATLTGIDVAKEIRKKDDNCIIVFMTTSCDHALDAYSVDAMQYLIKPIVYDKVEKIFDKCQELFLDNMRFIEVLHNGICIKVLLKDIYYIEVYDKACLIHTQSSVIKTYNSLSKICDLLGGTPFLKCHRSYIINMFYINDMLVNDFLLENGDKIPISRDEKIDIKQTYSDYFFQQMRGV